MPELDDYTRPFEPDLERGDSSRKPLLRLMTVLEPQRDEPPRTPKISYRPEQTAIEHYLINDHVKEVPLKLPPRKSMDDVSCAWELTLEKEKQPRFQGRKKEGDKWVGVWANRPK